MKKDSNSQTKTGQKTKPAKARGPVQQESKEVMAELVAKLSERLEQKPTQEKAAEGRPKGAPAPNRDRLTVGVDLGDQWSNYWSPRSTPTVRRSRLTVGVDLGDQWSNYCILGLEGETLGEGQLRTTREDLAAYGRIWRHSLRH